MMSNRSPAATATATTNTNMNSRFSHTPTSLTLFWMLISLPLVIWDTGYVLGRPHTMPGGNLHWPLYVPYKLYGEVDYVYGLRAFEARSGFTAAQASLNALETVMYMAYVGIWWWRGRTEAVATGQGREVRRRTVVVGREGALALLVGFSAAVMTLSKTFLYWAHEYYSEFANIGHNTPFDLLLLWIIPNGAWLVGSTYMVWSMGSEILDGLAGPKHAKRD